MTYIHNRGKILLLEEKEREITIDSNQTTPGGDEIRDRKRVIDAGTAVRFTYTIINLTKTYHSYQFVP